MWIYIFHSHRSRIPSAEQFIKISVYKWMKLKYKKYLLWARYPRKNEGRNDKERDYG
jgi:hypothetical protein